MRSFGEFEGSLPVLSQYHESIREATDIEYVTPYYIPDFLQTPDSQYTSNITMGSTGDAVLDSQRVQLKFDRTARLRRDGVEIQAVVGLGALVRADVDLTALEHLLQTARRDSQSGLKQLGVLHFDENYKPLIDADWPLNRDAAGHRYDIMVVGRGSEHRVFKDDAKSMLPDTPPGKRAANVQMAEVARLRRRARFGQDAVRLIEAVIELHGY